MISSQVKSRQFRVYVIGLKPDVLTSRKFRSANPEYQEGKQCYYVGSTAHAPEVRAEQHRSAFQNKKGRKSCNKFAHAFFDGLRPKQYRHIPSFTDRDSAVSAEVLLAEKLRKKGFAVWQN